MKKFTLLKFIAAFTDNKKTITFSTPRICTVKFIAIFMLLMGGIAKSAAQCPTAPGNPNTYGVDSWIGYVYATIDTNNPPTRAFSAPTEYRGFITQNEKFDLNLAAGAISGANVCGSYTDLFAVRYRMTRTFPSGNYTFTIGGDDGVRLSFDGGVTFPITDWNYHSYQTTTQTIHLSGTYNLVFENYDQGGESRASFTYTATCDNISSAPTSITGTTAICNGSSTILTADGGTALPGAYYQWGTGNVGQNIIANQNAASITVSPTGNTTYWVRRLDPAPCGTVTSGVQQLVTVTNPASAPTGISGIPNVCPGGSTTLTATGGNGNAYEWGTGIVGQNIIANQTSASIVVSPTVNTTYWVRRTNAAPCQAFVSAAFSLEVTVNAPAGDQTSYGTNSWIGYVYSDIASTPPPNGFSTNYRGYITETETFNHDWGAGNVSGPNICSSYGDRFAIRYRMKKNFTAGYYNFTVGGDDGYRLSLDGGATFPVSNWVDHSYTTTVSAGFYLSGEVSLVLEFYENGGSAQVSFAYSSCPSLSTAPTSISNATTLCTSANINLSAIGGTAGAGSTYQWGTGSVIGQNIIANQSNANYDVNPTATTIYWVRRLEAAPCLTPTGGATITVYKSSTQPTSITGTNSICAGSTTTLTAAGGYLSDLGKYQWGTGNTGDNIIANQTGVSIAVTPSATTTYWVRRIDVSPCGTNPTNAATYNVTVSVRSTAPTSISNLSTICNRNGNVNLEALGGTAGTNVRYEWGTGTVAGQNTTNNNNYPTLSVNPTGNVVTYWVRRVDTGICAVTTDAAFITIYRVSTSPTWISGSNTICSGSSTVLTAQGETMRPGAVYQWGTGSTIGENIIANQSAKTITVSPLTPTTYWVRALDISPCSESANGTTFQITTIVSPSTAPTSISTGAAACPGSSRTLTAQNGVLATNAVYQWGTGAVGTNVIANQTGVSITVTPSVDTTYWVRIKDSGTCTAYTAEAVANVTMVTAPGTPSEFGNEIWNVYGYKTADLTLTSGGYAGYYTQSSLDFDSTLSWGAQLSPSNASNWNGSCPIQADNFTFAAKRKGFTCGNYTLKMTKWDDAAEVYVDGVLAWNNGGYCGGNCNNNTVGTFNLNSNSTIEIRLRETGGDAYAVLAFTNNTVASGAPTGLAVSNAVICSGGSSTLTASGGTVGTNGVFQWGSGNVGSNIIANQTGSQITVNPTVTTTYWVRRINSLCGQTTSALTQTVTITGTVAGTLNTAAATICKGTKPKDIVLSGQSGTIIKWQSATNAAFTTEVADISVTTATLASSSMTAINQTTYYRAVVQSGSCAQQSTTPIQITIPPTVTYQNGVWSATPDATSSVEINSSLTVNNNLNVCSCEVKNGAVVTIPSGKNLIIVNHLTVDPSANIIVEDSGSIVQVDDNATDIGIITVKRKTSPMKEFDFCFWSAPVLGTTLFQLSPETRYDKYMSFDPIINNWQVIVNGTETMQPAKGYIVRSPLGWSVTNAFGGRYEGIFRGVPNNGVIQVPIKKGAGASNFLGNPYPSAIDLDLFLTDPTNAGFLTGTVMLWTHNTAISSTINGGAVYNYTVDDYAKYNLTGGTKAASTPQGGVRPDGKLASGQGFFIEAKASLANGTYTGYFRNSMRVASNNGNFYKVGPSVAAQNTSTLEKNRLWINISNTQGAFNELLLGYITGATNNNDDMYDGEVVAAGSVVTFYTIAQTKNYAIQGRQLPFDQNETVPVGYKSTIAGDYSIQLEEFDGLFNNQNVYLMDHLTNTTHNLKIAPYTFTTAIGTFNSRFEIKYTNNVLGIDDVNFDAQSVKIAADGKATKIKATDAIKSVEVYDLLGRMLYSNNKVNASEFRTNDLTQATQVLIVKVKMENNHEVSQKIMIR